MRVAAIFGILGLANICAFAQTVDFNNARTFLTTADRFVRNVDGTTPLVGTNYVAQLYYGSNAGSLKPVTSNPCRFRNIRSTDQLAGTWSGAPRTVPGFNGGDVVTLQIVAWNSAGGATYENAGVKGASAIFTYRIQPPGDMSTGYYIENFRGFALTNSPERTLAIQENGDQVDLLYSGTHTIQGASSLSGPWVTLTTSSGPYTDPASGTNRQRFYRMRDEPGPTYSVNVVGYYRVDVCAGFSLLANQLNASGGNAVPNVLKSPQERTEIYKYSPVVGGYISLSYLGGAWEGDDLEMTLSPGEGAFLYSPVAQSLRFLGEVPLSHSVQIPSGVSNISAPLPRSGRIDQMNFPVVNGITIFDWECDTGYGYRINVYLGGAWEGSDEGAAPDVRVGESFWVHNPGPPITWNGIYCINCP